MGSKSNIKQVKTVTLKEVIAEAVAKYPGYNKSTALLQYYRLLVTVCAKKTESPLKASLSLLTLFMNGVEYFSTEGRN